jgi:membrane associated rhomboid family serine protease
MRQAAVGFQCPNCVKEGSRSVRAPRAAYGGKRSTDPRLTSFVLIGINVVVWLAILADGGSDGKLVDKLALLPDFGVRVLSGGIVEKVPGVADGDWWQVVTSVFTHVEPLHIGLNMLTLYFLGPPVEAILGRARFLALYLVSGLAGSAAVMLFSDSHQQTLGASGAIYGLMGALVVLAHKVGNNPQQILIWIALNLALTFSVANISWQGHIGGLIGGGLLAAAFAYAPRVRRSLLQWSAVGVLVAIALAAIVVRAASFTDSSRLGG